MFQTITVAMAGTAKGGRMEAWQSTVEMQKSRRHPKEGFPADKTNLQETDLHQLTIWTASPPITVAFSEIYQTLKDIYRLIWRLGTKRPFTDS